MIRLPALPISDLVVFPRMMVPLFLSEGGAKEAVQAAEATGGRLFVVTLRKSGDPVTAENCHPTGTICSIVRSMPLADGRLKVLVHGEVRARHSDWRPGTPIQVAVEPIDTPAVSAAERIEMEALARSVLENLDKVIQLGRALSPDVLIGVEGLSPEQLPDALGAQLALPVEDSQKILEAIDPLSRLRALSEVLAREAGILGVKAEIETHAKEEMSKSQREYYLREQMRLIRHELGESDERGPEVAEYGEKVKKAKLSPEAKKEAEKQMQRLEQMHPDSAEAAILKSYLDWILDLPWTKTTKDRLDLTQAREILEEDHYNLLKVKQRILEFLAVRKLKGGHKGPILCFVGPPGVGKTSLGKSIAKCLDRQFVRISLGGIKDEAEIRGHRRTYVGALPGRIIQGIKQAGVRNPVFMLDEIDKVGTDFRGDPASALLEVLDPEQNKTFSDHYLSIPFDLSEVLFITTANQLEPIPHALRDRMEVIEIAGYSEEEKLHIARKFLLPRQLSENGISEKQLEIPDAAMQAVVTNYTRESGLRGLEREIAAICRKVALEVADGKERPHKVTGANLSKYLGPAKFEPMPESETDEIGVATGLAWTPVGGEMLYVEAQYHRGKRGLVLTGHLGQVMKESAQAALSYLRTRSDLPVQPDFFAKNEIHLHVPEGAISKDGPSAGITMASAIYSVLSRRPLRKRIAMTGEITLRGRVLPVGGIREKLLAARRMGIRRIVIPKSNLKDLEDLPKKVRSELEIIPVEGMDQVLSEVVCERPRREGAATPPKPLKSRRAPARSPAGRKAPSPRRPLFTRAPAARPLRRSRISSKRP